MSEIGKTPPQSLESEKIVLGTLMSERNAYAEVADVIDAECFYLPSHKRIYETICRIRDEGKFPDMITVSQAIDDGELWYEIAEIAGFVSAEMYQHALYLKEQYIRRQVINLSAQAIEQAYTISMDVDEVINNLADAVKNVYNHTAEGVIHISEAVESMRENIKVNMKSQVQRTGSPTGFKALDEKSGGLQETDLVVIAGESSMGKTSFALSVINNIAESRIPVAVYSLEMSSIQLAARLTAMRTGVPSNEILYSPLTHEQFERIEIGVSRICNLGIYIDERSTSNLDTIIASIRNMVIKYGIRGAVVDYLQILSINERGVSEETKLGIAARKLKNLAKETNIWIIALSQLNRDINPYPTLSRLRGSGQIGEAADVVAFIYRPEYYSKSKTYPDDFSEITTRGTALIDVAKGRNIGTFRFPVKFKKEITHFEDIDDLDKYRIGALLPEDDKRVTPF